MRKFFFLSLLVLAIVVAGFSLLESSDGYVLVAISGYTIEMPFFVALLINILFFVALYFAFSALRLFTQTRKNVAGWASNRRQQRGLNRTTQGLVAFVEGRWDFARRSLEKAASSSSTPLVNYLFAARASSAIGDSRAVDDFLKKAELSTEGADVAIGLTQAELQLQSKQYEQSLATLLRVKKQANNHPVVLSLLARVYGELNDWPNLLKLVPALRQGSMPERELDSLEQYACKALLEQAGAEGSAAVQACWRNLPASACRRPVIIAYYAEQLLACGDSVQAESVLRGQLQRVYDQQLVEIYGRARGDNAEKQLVFAHKLLKSHAGDSQLLITLARLSLGQGTPEKAKDYYEQSLAAEPTAMGYSELAELHAAQGNFKLSAELYAKGAQLPTPA